MLITFREQATACEGNYRPSCVYHSHNDFSIFRPRSIVVDKLVLLSGPEDIKEEGQL